MKNYTVKSLRQELKGLFQSHGIESPVAEADLLIMHITGLLKKDILLGDAEVSKKDRETLLTLAERRIKGEPIQYIIGSCDFMDLTFSVNPSTLIPRPETELLVEEVVKIIGDGRKIVWDIGCGSGCIGITLAHLCPDIYVTEIDISKEALATAKTTAEKYGLCDRIEFLEHDILKGMIEGEIPDVIVSNPPYIPEKDIAGLQTEVRNFEPISALVGGEDGLVFYKKIIGDAVLKEGGVLAFEIGYDQGESVSALMKSKGYSEVRVIRDYSGNDRIVLGYK